MALNKRKRSEASVITRSKKRATNPKNHDPFDYLNEHCLGFVLHFLAPVDIIHCRAVCVKWRDLMHGWISTLGVRLHFPMSWTRGYCKEDPALAVESYKQLAFQDHAFKHGKATRARLYASHLHFQAKQRNIVWVHYSMNSLGLWHGRVFWERLPEKKNGKGGIRGRSKVLNLRTIFKTTSTIEILNLYLNENGLLYLRGREGHGHDLVKDTVYSLIDGNEIWHHSGFEYSVNPYENVPLSLGRDRMYYVRMPRLYAEARLCAFDIHSGMELYDVALGPIRWRTLFSHWDRQLELIRVRGDEFIVQLHSEKSDTLGDRSWITIINAAKGLIVQELNCAPSPSEVFTSDSGKLILISRSKRVILYDDVTGTRKPMENLTTIEQFVYQPDGIFTRGLAEAVFHPNHEKILVNGLTNQVLSLDSTRRVLAHDLKEIRGSKLKYLQHEVTGPLPKAITVGRSYTLAQGRAITLPPRPGAKVSTRRPLELGSPFILTAQFIDGGRIRIPDKRGTYDDTVIINFNPT